MNWCCHFHTDTHVLTSHVGKLMKLLFFEYSYLRDTDNLLDVFLLFLLVILSEQHEIKEKKNELQEYRFSNILGN